MKRFFLIQCLIIFLLVFIQIYIQFGQEGIFEVLFQALGSFAILFSLTIVLSFIVTALRKLMNRKINFGEGILRISIFVLPLYYVAQLLGWLNR